MGRLMFGPYSLRVSWRRVGPAFLGRLVAGKALGSDRLAVGVEPGPKVPTQTTCQTHVRHGFI